ncbi:MAG: hypothetical protein QG614_565 [Patescibacteria group bacterium]|nr:hypothetical protein [Patescibacteria group bacterium]
MEQMNLAGFSEVPKGKSPEELEKEQQLSEIKSWIKEDPDSFIDFIANDDTIPPEEIERFIKLTINIATETNMIFEIEKKGPQIKKLRESNNIEIIAKLLLEQGFYRDIQRFRAETV